MPQRTPANCTLTTASATGLAASQKPGSASALTFNGALISGGTYTAEKLGGDNGTLKFVGHKIAIASDADDSAHTFTIVGTNPDGIAVTETITGPNSTTVNSVNFFSTVSSVSINAAATGNLTVGTASVVQTPTVQINTRTSSFAASNAVVISGTINYTLAHTFDNIMKTSSNMVAYKPTVTCTYFDDATIASQTGNKAAALALIPAASHITINSYSAGATFRWSIVEAYVP